MELTNSSIFLLRGLEIVKTSETLDIAFITTGLGFKNAYLKDKNRETDLEYPLFLLFQPKDIAVFQEFTELEYDTGLLKEDYDYPEGHVVLLYDFPVIFREDYHKILEGKYSKVSMGYRLLFPENTKRLNKKVKTLTYHIFNKSPLYQMEREVDLGLDAGTLDGIELWPLFNEEKETLDINKILKNEHVRYIENKEGTTEELRET